MKTLRVVSGIFICFIISFADLKAGTIWHIRDSGSTNQFNGVAYGNGLFVAVGSHATILTSPDGVQWTQRAAGTTVPTLDAAAYGKNLYLAGGSEGALLLSATDGINWSNVLVTTGQEHIHGITYVSGVFVAVGEVGIGATYIGLLMTSTNGVDWTRRTIPTTNRLYAVTPPVWDGIGWAEDLFVAVGDNGTIITSTNKGVDWVLRDSGTTARLRAIVFHASELIAGGDNGIVVASSDGFNWTQASPTSFHIRGLASSWDEAVAVGNFCGTFGRLHVSQNGTTWPGTSTEFPHPLNGVTYGAGTFVAVGNDGFILQSESFAEDINSWTKPTSGYWEEPYWSLGVLPNLEQAGAAFTNAGWKALAIGTNTTAKFAENLKIRNLTVEAPQDSRNTLVLNFAGVEVPLFVKYDLVLGSNGAIVSEFSALAGGNLLLSSTAAFLDSSKLCFSNIVLGVSGPGEFDLTNSFSDAENMVVSLRMPSTVNQAGGVNQMSHLAMFSGSVYNLSAGALLTSTIDLQSEGDFKLPFGWQLRAGLAQLVQSEGELEVDVARIGLPQFPGSPAAEGEITLSGGQFRANALNFANGSFIQSGGTNRTDTIMMPWLDFSRGKYLLSGGALLSSNVVLGAVVNPSFLPGDFQQTGGVHSNSIMTLYGEIRHQAVSFFGSYTLIDGLFSSSSVNVNSGLFSQRGGTNYTTELTLNEAGAFELKGGQLITSNTTIDTSLCVQGDFLQTAGTHSVSNLLLLQDFVRYRLQGGTLVAPAITVGPGAEFRAQGGVISNAGTFTLSSGALRVIRQELHLGKLDVVGVPTTFCTDFQPTGPTLDANPADNPGPSTTHFKDSHDVAWSDSALYILHWSSTTNGFGPHHVFVGTSAQGLTKTQLSQIFFVNPVGLPPGNYPSQILNTGEIIPVPYLAFNPSSTGMVLSWEGNYELLTATNVEGPYFSTGASSPVTNGYTNFQSYFLLRTP